MTPRSLASTRPHAPALATTVLVGAWALLGVAGCGSPPDIRALNPDEPGVVDLTDPSGPVPVEAFMQPPAARIAPGDQLAIQVLNYPREFPPLSGSVLVAPDGKINLGLLGSVEVVGKTVDELDRELTNAYSAYIRNVDLSVNVEIPAKRNVYVLGMVRTPGRFDFAPGDRVLHGLALAGGMEDDAREDSVILLRRGEDGKDHAYRLDFSHLHERLAPQDIYLQPGDVVFVPKNRFATFTEFATSFLDMLAKSTTSALVIDDLVRLRNRAVTVGR